MRKANESGAQAQKGVPMAIPAKRIDKPPRYRYAVLSVSRGSDTAELESSFDSESQAARLFDSQYSRWGLVDKNFYLVDWEKQTIIREHVVWR